MLRYFLVCSYLFAFWLKADDHLRFVVNDPGSSPYLFYDNAQKKYVGIIPEVLQGVTQLNIRFISNSRKRSEEYIYADKADMIMLSKAWLKHPEKVIATITIHQHRSFLYRTKEFPENFSLEKLHKTELVCTRKGYFYPTLKIYFDNKILERVDSSSQISMMKMLLKKRCDYTAMSEFNAQNVLRSSALKNKVIYRSKQPISMVPLHIILRAEFAREKAILDKHIRQLQESGEFTRILTKYVNTAMPND